MRRYDILAHTDQTGDGKASIAGGQGTMWATALQIGELVEMAERVSSMRVSSDLSLQTDLRRVRDSSVYCIRDDPSMGSARADCSRPQS
jgi:hypothetical protein